MADLFTPPLPNGNEQNRQRLHVHVHQPKLNAKLYLPWSPFQPRTQNPGIWLHTAGHWQHPWLDPSRYHTGSELNRTGGQETPYQSDWWDCQHWHNITPDKTNTNPQQKPKGIHVLTLLPKEGWPKHIDELGTGGSLVQEAAEIATQRMLMMMRKWENPKWWWEESTSNWPKQE